MYALSKPSFLRNPTWVTRGVRPLTTFVHDDWRVCIVDVDACFLPYLRRADCESKDVEKVFEWMLAGCIPFVALSTRGEERDVLMKSISGSIVASSITTLEYRQRAICTDRGNVVVPSTLTSMPVLKPVDRHLL